MSEWRHDPLSDRWVIIAPERALRPDSARTEEGFAPLTDDPFAEGHEDATTSEVFAIRPPQSRPDGPGWQVRSILNKYPALRPELDADIDDDGWFRRAPGGGVHEVIVECPQPETHLSRLSAEHVRQVLIVYRSRLAALRRESRWAYAIIFKNHGPGAGATLAHAHSQLMALPFVPAAVTAELSAARRFRAATGGAFFAAWMERERAAQQRLVCESPEHLSLCPFASRFPYELCLLPRQPGPHFDELCDAALADLAGHLKELLQRLEAAANDPPYNLVLRTAPFQEQDVDGFSWRLEILPRIGRIAGYEWGTGWHINLVPPEVAAQRLRDAR